MDAAGRVIGLLARWTAIAGGLVLVAITLVTVASIAGRAMLTLANLHDTGAAPALVAGLRAVGGFFTGLGARPIPGDYELVEAGTAFAVFAFLPWCHLNRGHAAVEILAPLFGDRGNRVIDVVANLLMLAIALLIGWRHWLGTLDKYGYGETTFILQFPLWWGYAAGMVGAVVFVIVSTWCLVRSVADLSVRGKYDLPGAMH